MSSRIPNEQPMSKRQRIDATDANKKNGDKSIRNATNGAPPDILPINHSNEIMANDELDNAAAGSFNRSSDSLGSENQIHRIVEFPDLIKTTSIPPVSEPTDFVPTMNENANASNTSPSHTPIVPIENHSNSNGHPHTNISTTPSCSNSNISNSNSVENTNETSGRLSNGDSINLHSPSNSTGSIRQNIEVDDFQLLLTKQCLCDISERSLRRTFAGHYFKDANGVKHHVPLSAWPSDKLIQLLSNMEFLFEVYLNQNTKGEICTRIMQVCDALLLNDQNIIEGIFQLDECSNQYVRYLAIKVLANCILIAKDKDEYCENLLTTLMSNLIVHHEPDDRIALDKVSFISAIIVHIMEWRDNKKHPLDDQIVINGREVYNDSDNENFPLPLELPPIENNYFSVQRADETVTSPSLPPSPSPSSPSTPTPSGSQIIHSHTSNIDRRPIEQHANELPRSNDASRNTSCLLQYLSDSESFDSKDLKYMITSMLGNKWSMLVENMANCVTLLQSNRSLHYIENTILTFLTLWERIIDVDTCLSFESTLPFHKKLTIFEEILIRGNLPVPIYKQILTLFSASLCYTTTLALQSEVPQETNHLANEIFNSVKSQRIFSSLPRLETELRNDIGFIGYKHPTIVYELASIQTNDNDNHDEDDDDDDSSDESLLDETFSSKSVDFILLQKLVLLILKAIVVTVRPIRNGDSSDSSMDSCSSNSSTADHEAFVVERVTRDVFKKLKLFLETKLDYNREDHLSKIIVHLFKYQDDYLIEAMLCMLGTTITFLPRHPPFGNRNNTNRTTSSTETNQFRELIDMISPVYAFLEFLDTIDFDMQLMLDHLITDDTCFLLYFLRFLKYIRNDFDMFWNRCSGWAHPSNPNPNPNSNRSTNRSEVPPVLERVMGVLTQLRYTLDRLVLRGLFPYNISPMIELLRKCESLYEEPI